MKHFKVIALIAAMACMSSCLVSSLHPFFKKDDKRFDPLMVGQWLDTDSCLWVIEANKTSESFMGPEKHDSSYRVTYYEEEDGPPSKLVGTLFSVKGVDYVDFTPDPDEDHCMVDMTCFHHVPVHTLARVQYNKDSIMLFWYGDEWLNELFEEKRIRIKHEKVAGLGYDRHVLTADTDELQKFIRKFANDPQTEDNIQKIFARGNTDGQDELGVFLKLKPANL
jgi:hypothetical protein